MSEEQVSQAIGDERGPTALIEVAVETSMPFVCGVCHSQFDKITQYYVHFKEHGSTFEQLLHVCDNLHSSESNLITCEMCKMVFPSVCMFHNHVSVCSGTRSYLYNHRRNTATPVYDSSFGVLSRTDEAEDKEGLNASSQSEKTSSSFSEHVLHDSPSESNGSITSLQPQAKESLNESNSKSVVVDKSKSSTTQRLGQPRTAKVKAMFGRRFTKKQFAEISMPGKPLNDLLNENKRVTDSKDQNKNDCFLTSKEKSEKALLLQGCQTDMEKELRTIKTTDDVTKEDIKKVNKESKIQCPIEILSVVRSKISGNKPTLKVPSEDVCKETQQKMQSENMDAQSDIKSPLEKGHMLSKEEEKRSKAKKPSGKGRKKQKEDHICEICGKVWQSKCKLKNHLYSHTQVPNFRCEVCQVSFRYPRYLKVHMKTHCEVKPFYCELCGEGFIESTRLKMHKIHKHTTDKKYKCTKCSCAFKFMQGLKRHLLSHNDEKAHQCDVCGQQFNRKYYLVQHMWIHTNNRRFQCSEDGCSRRFFTNYQLQCHLKVHTGERPYKCSCCPAAFIQRKELRKHMKKVHSMNLDMLDTAEAQVKQEKIEPVDWSSWEVDKAILQI